jgi:exonuclease III
MIYINKRLKARQTPIDSSALTAITITQGEETMLIISVYVEQCHRIQENYIVLQQSINKIRQTIQQLKQRKPDIQIIIAGDFNRYDELWGGTLPNAAGAGEAEPILELLGEFQLWSALPQGTTTFRNWGNTQQSTINLMLISSSLRQRIQACKTHDTDHGSDHSATFLTLNYKLELEIPKQRRSYNMPIGKKFRRRSK